jgi:hypothetical protein
MKKENKKWVNKRNWFEIILRKKNKEKILNKNIITLYIFSAVQLSFLLFVDKHTPKFKLQLRKV